MFPSTIALPFTPITKPLCIAVVDGKRRVLKVPSEFTYLIGRSSEDLNGFDAKALFHHDRSSFTQLLNGVLQSGERVFNYLPISSSKDHRRLLVSLDPVRSGTELMLGVDLTLNSSGEPMIIRSLERSPDTIALSRPVSEFSANTHLFHGIFDQTTV